MRNFKTEWVCDLCGFKETTDNSCQSSGDIAKTIHVFPEGWVIVCCKTQNKDLCKHCLNLINLFLQQGSKN